MNKISKGLIRIARLLVSKTNIYHLQTGQQQSPREINNLAQQGNLRYNLSRSKTEDKAFVFPESGKLAFGDKKFEKTFNILLEEVQKRYNRKIEPEEAEELVFFPEVTLPLLDVENVSILQGPLHGNAYRVRKGLAHPVKIMATRKGRKAEVTTIKEEDMDLIIILPKRIEDILSPSQIKKL